MGEPADAADVDDVALVAARVSLEASQPVDLDLLAPFIRGVQAVAASGGRLRRDDLELSESVGRRAALSGVALASLVDGYLSASRIVWLDTLPSASPAPASRQGPDPVAVGEAIFRAADAALAAVARGFGSARQGLVRREESERREFIDDLLVGSGDTARIVARGDRFGLLVTAPHTVAVARAVDGFWRDGSSVAQLEQRLRVLLPGRDMLVATKDADLVLVFGERRDAAGPTSTDGRLLSSVLREVRRGGDPAQVVRLSAGPTLDGSVGIAESYRAARQGADLAELLGWTDPLVRPEQVAVYAVLLRDRKALVDLVETVLAPLKSARGGARPLLDTLLVYLGAGGVATETARRMNLSVRAVTYRLARVKKLTGWDPMDPATWLTLQVASEGARILGWPQEQS